MHRSILCASAAILAVALFPREANALSIPEDGVQIVEPAPPAAVPRYAKIELLVTLSGAAATNVYDSNLPDGLDLGATFTGPGGIVRHVHGFFDGSNWRVRFAPDAAGDWTYGVQATDAGGTASWSGGAFTCASSPHPGFARVDGRILRFSNGSAFFGVGHNTGWQYDVEQPSLPEMAARGENLLSFWLSVPWARPSWASVSEPWWDKRAAIENVEGGVGNFNQAACAYLDGVVSRAEAETVYLLPSLWSHGQLRASTGHPWGAGWWDDNPYKALCTASDFFKTSTGTGDTPQWRAQKNFYRYVMARWGHSRSIVGWVTLVEIDGTTAWNAELPVGSAGSRPVSEGWCAAVRAFLASQDPYRGNAAGPYPAVTSRTDYYPGFATWASGEDMRAADSYTQQGSNIEAAGAIASQTAAMRASGKPAFHTEFGGNEAWGATQPAHLHNGIWAALSSGAAMTPLVWCDAGSFPMLTPAMQDHLEILARFASALGDLGDPALAPATVAASGTCRGWGLRKGGSGFAWVQNTTAGGTMGGQTLSIFGLPAGTYDVSWFDAWTDGTNPFRTDVVAAGTGTLNAAIPSLARPDVACRFAIRPGPDLVVSALSATATGRTVTVTDTVKNQGSTAIGATFTVRTFLSADASITSADILLGSRTVAGLGAGASSARTVTFTTATDLPSGTYFVGAIADATGVVTEANEANNAKASPSAFAFRPDLAFSAFSAKIASGKVSISNTFKNNGAAATVGTTAVAFYLSPDAIFSPSTDVLLGGRARTSALKAGATDAATSAFAAPASLSPGGNYHVFAVADSGASQIETNESNNVAGPSVWLPIRADLVVSSLSASVSPLCRTLTVKDTVKNQGPLATPGSFQVCFYLSKDATITAADTFIGSRTISSSLAYNAVNQATTAIAVPTSVAAGAWRVGAIVDGGTTVPELLENNNAKASSSLTIGP